MTDGVERDPPERGGVGCGRVAGALAGWLGEAPLAGADRVRGELAVVLAVALDDVAAPAYVRPALARELRQVLAELDVEREPVKEERLPEPLDVRRLLREVTR